MYEALKEKVAHGSVRFPIGVFNAFDNPSDVVTYLHWHEEVEFFYLTEGAVLFQIDDRNFMVGAGQAVFVNTCMIHGGLAMKKTPCRFHAVSFNPKLLINESVNSIQNDMWNDVISNELAVPIHIKGEEAWERDVLNRLYRISELYIHKPYAYEFTIAAYLHMIIADMIANSATCIHRESIDNSNRSEYLRKAFTYIYNNYNQKISVEDLAREASMSVGHFYRYFKKMTSKTPVDYINCFRVGQAAALLNENDKHISYIALTTGFDNISYFNNVFKRYMGCTPRDYRMRMKAGA